MILVQEEQKRRLQAQDKKRVVTMTSTMNSMPSPPNVHVIVSALPALE